MQRVFITGANRGIGLELTRQYLARGERVFATARQPESAGALLALADRYQNALTVLQLDVSDESSIAASAQATRQHTDALDVLINNAGINPRQPAYLQFEALQFDALLEVLRVNSVAPMIVTRHYLDLVKAGNQPKVINVSSQLGSLHRKTSGGTYAYSASKSALNMYTRAMAADLVPWNVIAVAVHPGWVQTDMGGPSAPLTSEDSASAMLKTIDALTKDHNGGFLRWDGETLPW